MLGLKKILIKKIIASLLIILLSALLYNLAFFYSAYFGFSILISLFLIFYFFSKNEQSLKSSFSAGFLWGTLVFSAHFIWLLRLLLEKINSCKSFAIFTYIFAIVYFSFISVLWFCFLSFFMRLFKSNRLVKGSIFCGTVYGYFYVLENYALWFLGRLEGYPFLNPLIPLIGFKPFVKILFCMGLWCRQVDFEKFKNIEFIYLKPSSRQVEQNWVDVEYKIFEELCKLKLWEREDCGKEFIIFSPESSFPFPLNRYKSAIELWSNVLPVKSHFFLGSQIIVNEKLCQSVYWLNQRRIKNYYVKKHCVPFVEKIPKIYNKLDSIQRIFIGDVCQFSRAKKLHQNGYFKFSNELILIPQICSELFFTSSYKFFSDIKEGLGMKSQVLLVFFVNDSWFVDYFKNILFHCAQLKSFLSGVPLFYVGHQCMYLSAIDNSPTIFL